MPVNIYKLLIASILVFVMPRLAICQVYGRNFYYKYDQNKYSLSVASSSIYDGNCYKPASLSDKIFERVFYKRVCFVNLKKDNNYPGNKSYESLLVTLSDNTNKAKRMVVIINGFFDQRFNYELNLDFKEGLYLIKLPGLEDGLLKLPDCSVEAGCKNVSSLLVQF